NKTTKGAFYKKAPFRILTLLKKLLLFFNPLSSVYKSFQPRRYFVVPVFWVISPVPLECRTLNMGHSCQVPSCFVAQHGCIEIRTIWVVWIFAISIFGNNIVLVFIVW